MSITVEVIVPISRGQIKIKYARAPGFRHIRNEEDAVHHRYFIAFYEKDVRETTGGVDVFDTSIVHDPSFPIEHSLTGLAIVENAVVGQDKRMVRDGNTEA